MIMQINALLERNISERKVLYKDQPALITASSLFFFCLQSKRDVYALMCVHVLPLMVHVPCTYCTFPWRHVHAHSHT